MSRKNTKTATGDGRSYNLWLEVNYLSLRSNDTLDSFHYSAPFEQVSFSPVDVSLACVCGNSIFQFYRVIEGGEGGEGDLRPMTVPRMKDHNFTSHTWLKQPEDYLVVGTETGQLLLFRSGDFLCYLVGAPGGSTKITAMLSYSQVI